MIVELARRFRELTDAETKDPESLMSLADAGLLKGMTWADVLRRPRVVLLAEAGSGKTFEMRERAKQLRAEGKAAFFLPLEALDEGTIADLLDKEEERAFEEWKKDDQSAAWLFLDAVDELKLTQGRLEHVLRRVAKEIDGCLHRVHVVVSCRPTDWRPSLDLASMRRAFPTTPASVAAVPSEESFLSVLRKPEQATRTQDKGGEPEAGFDDTYFVVLLPLDQPQIEAFAKALGVADVAGFIAELRRQDAWSFARRPFDLADLIGTWKLQGRLGTRAEQHEANVAARLKDDHERPDRGVLTDSEARTGAEQLALSLALTRTRTIRAPELVVDVDYVTGVLDSSSILVDWSEEKRQSLLRRALFDPATYGRVRFHHRSVQEYLAARRLNVLREKGMATSALSRLLFAERYGVPVVIPSMRAIAAWLALWNDHVRRELISREPETLLSMGDPESLPISVRSDLLRAFVRAYGVGGRRGLHIPIEEVRRLAHPELGSVVRELWGGGPTNDDVRELLLDLIEQGAMQQCSDACLLAALDTSLPERHRYMAVRALAACRQSSAIQEIVQSILNNPTDWPIGLIAQLVDDLFPDYFSASDVVRFTEMPSARKVRTDFSHNLRRIATIVAPLSQPASELRDLLAKLIRDGRGAEELGYRNSRFEHLVPALATLCSRQIEASVGAIDNAIVEASAIASRFGERATGGNEAVTQLRQHFAVDMALRSRVFWQELAFTDSFDSSGDAWRRLRRMQRDSLVGDLTVADWDWLRKAAVDGADAGRRSIAVQALILAWIHQGRPNARIEDLRDVARDDASLTSMVEAWVRPPEADPTIEEFNRRERERLAEAAVKEEARLKEWTEWREELIADPAGAFSPAKRLETVSILHRWLDTRERETARYNVWEAEALAAAFGNEIATLARTAFEELWRQERPVLWSRRPPEERNSTLYSWIRGLCGVAAEATSTGWAGRLTTADARVATEYATIEINSLPAWLKDLTVAHPAEVEAVLGSELEAELQLAAGVQHLPLLQGVAYGDSALKSILAPRLVRLLATWPRQFADEKAAASSARHLTQMLGVLDANISSQERQFVVDTCEARFESDLTSPLGMVWLRGIFRWAPDRGASVFERGLALVEEGQRAPLAAAAFAELLGDRSGPSFDLGSFAERARSLGILVRLAYEFIRPADDQRHDDVYTPNSRDEAERARGFLLSALLDTPGAEAQEILAGLAGSPAFAGNPDRLRLLARERAAKDAEHAAFLPGDYVALERRYEAPPHDRDGMFSVMVDRLDDLAADIASHDFTDRRTLQSIGEEVEMQRTLALRLEAAARGAYTVTREAEVADAKRTDIRVAAVRGNQKATIEIKIADKGWSVKDLERALREQLVGQYLCHDSCKAGCLLLTHNGEKKYWEHPQTSTPMTFSDLLAHLSVLARTIEVEQGHAVRLSVRGLDLRNPS